MSVSGMNFLNSPTIPDQNSSGKNGAMVVSRPGKYRNEYFACRCLYRLLDSPVLMLVEKPVRVFDYHNGVIHHKTSSQAGMRTKRWCSV